MTETELAVLRALALKGRADVVLVAAASGVAPDAAQEVLTVAEARGDVKAARDAFRLTPEGRDRVRSALEDERVVLNQPALEACYERFHGPNDALKRLMSDWQVRDGEPNLHDDAAYDGEVAARLGALHDEVGPLVADVVALVGRLAPVPGRLQHAADGVAAGDHAWIARPTLDSWHTVWFELHEELIALLGRTRQAEAEAGRAA